MKRLLHLIVWLCVFVFWFLASRNHHPTWVIDALATTILLLATAACFYFHDAVLRPRFLNMPTQPVWGRALSYVASLCCTVVVLDFAAVLLIQGVYDRLWGPDPLRFGFWTNVLYEALFIVIHLVVGVLIATVVQRWRRGRG